MSINKGYIYSTNLTIKESSNDCYYQSLESSVKDLTINVEKNANVEFLFFNSKLNLEVNQSELSNVTIYNVYLLDESSQININVNLNERDSFVKIINVYLTKNTNKLVSNVLINHKALSTSSDLETYAIAQNESNQVLNNNAHIYNGMHNSNAHQTTKGLCLNKNSKIQAQPNLFIDEYDVQASHSASIGSIDSEELFYLMSRGLTESKAREMIVMGFIIPIIDKIQDEEVKQNIYKQFTNSLK